MKKGILPVIVAAALVFLLNAKALAQAEQGAVEIGLNASFLNHGTLTMERGDWEEETTGLSMMNRYNLVMGYFFTDSLEGGLRVDSSGGFPNLFFRYNFGEKLAPFIGLDLGIISISRDGEEKVFGVKVGESEYKETFFLIGGELGLKYYLTERVAFNLEYDLLYGTGTIDDGGAEDIDESVFVGNLMFGLAFVF